MSNILKDLQTGNEIVTKFGTFVITTVLKCGYSFYNKEAAEATGKTEISFLHNEMMANRLFLADVLTVNK